MNSIVLYSTVLDWTGLDCNEQYCIVFDCIGLD